MNEPICVKNYVAGKAIDSNDRRIIFDYLGNPTLDVAIASDRTIEAAIQQATVSQDRLKHTRFEDIISVLSKTMIHFFNTDEDYVPGIMITGSSERYFKGCMESTKKWCKQLEVYLKSALENGTSLYRNTAPTVTVLPSNSDQEFLYIAAQLILSKNASVVRPSSMGAGSYVAQKFVHALNKTLDDIDDDKLEMLRSSISVVNTQGRDYLDQLSIDGWNYVCFGEDSTVKAISDNIHKNIKSCIPDGKPLKVIGYGTGLSTTIVYDDSDWRNSLEDIMHSITVNCGNDCTSTDIIYVEEKIYEQFIESLREKAKDYRSGHPFEQGKNGLVLRSNIEGIYKEVARRGKLGFLDIEAKEGEYPLIHPSIIPTNRFQTAVEYPGPIVSVRSFSSLGELEELTKKDRRDNGDKKKNLVSSVYTSTIGKFMQTASLLSAYTIKMNEPTHSMDLNKTHQGIYLVRELMDKVELYDSFNGLYDFVNGIK